jgi:hypothetical protein
VAQASAAAASALRSIVGAKSDKERGNIPLAPVDEKAGSPARS